MVAIAVAMVQKRHGPVPDGLHATQEAVANHRSDVVEKHAWVCYWRYPEANYTRGVCKLAISLFELFKAGIGPSSSHTVGPMEAARRFSALLREQGLLASVHRVKVSLYGSLGATGKGHGSGPAIMMGLEGEQPALIDPDQMPRRIETIRDSGQLSLAGQHPVRFREKHDLVYHRRKSLPAHPNGMIC
jgi:serine dehydratase beta subunit